MAQVAGLSFTFCSCKNLQTAGSITKPIDKIMALDLDGFVELMVDEFEMEYEAAVLLFNKKHGIEDED